LFTIQVYALVSNNNALLCK